MAKKPMRLIVHVYILYDTKHVYAHLCREFETDLVPMVGMRLADPAWEDPRPVKDVIISPEEGHYLLNVGNDKCSDEKKCEQLKQVYQRRGWLSLGSVGQSARHKQKELKDIWPSLGKRKDREEQGP
jgi:hypothetical protein